MRAVRGAPLPPVQPTNCSPQFFSAWGCVPGGRGWLLFRWFVNSLIDRQTPWLLPGDGRRRAGASPPRPVSVA